MFLLSQALPRLSAIIKINVIKKKKFYTACLQKCEYMGSLLNGNVIMIGQSLNMTVFIGCVIFHKGKMTLTIAQHTTIYDENREGGRALMKTSKLLLHHQITKLFSCKWLHPWLKGNYVGQCDTCFFCRLKTFRTYHLSISEYSSWWSEQSNIKE